MCTPAEVVAGRAVIDEAAERAGRAISPEHFGVSIGYAAAPLSDRARAALGRRARGNPLEALVPVGLEQLRAHLESFIEVGFSKFVARPLVPPQTGERSSRRSPMRSATSRPRPQAAPGRFPVTNVAQKPPRRLRRGC